MSAQRPTTAGRSQTGTPACSAGKAAHGGREYPRWSGQPAMRRLYVRGTDRSWVPIGWWCPLCDAVTLDLTRKVAGGGTS